MVSEQDPERAKHIRSFRFVDENIGVVVENCFNCLREIFKKENVSLTRLSYQGEMSDNILEGCVSHDTAALATNGSMLSEKSRPKNNGEVLHRHRVFCRKLVYARKASSSTSPPRIRITATLPMQVAHEVFQRCIIGIRKFVDSFV